MEITNYILNRATDDSSVPDYNLGSTPIREQAVTAAQNYASQHNEPIDVTALYHDQPPKTVRYFPNGSKELLWMAEREGTTYQVIRADEEIKQDWPGFTYTGELLEASHNGWLCTYRVITGPYTPYGGCRDCGDHYIIAGHSSYRSISKVGFVVKRDVEDK